MREAFERFRLSAEMIPSGFRVSHGEGPRARVAEVSPEVTDSADFVAYAAGVKSALARPILTSVADWDFAEVAGRLVPTVERAAFAQGYMDAGGGQPWAHDFAAGDTLLRTHYYVELDGGHQLLTQAQVGLWGVTDDRITSASRSLLYYKTMKGERARHSSGLDCYCLGDGYDAARALVMPDLDYQRTRRGLTLAVPSPYLLLLASADTADEERIGEVARAAFQQARYPVSDKLYRWSGTGALGLLR